MASRVTFQTIHLHSASITPRLLLKLQILQFESHNREEVQKLLSSSIRSEELANFLLLIGLTLHHNSSGTWIPFQLNIVTSILIISFAHYFSYSKYP